MSKCCNIFSCLPVLGLCSVYATVLPRWQMVFLSVPHCVCLSASASSSLAAHLYTFLLALCAIPCSLLCCLKLFWCHIHSLDLRDDFYSCACCRIGIQIPPGRLQEVFCKPRKMIVKRGLGIHVCHTNVFLLGKNTINCTYIQETWNTLIIVVDSAYRAATIPCVAPNDGTIVYPSVSAFPTK